MAKNFTFSAESFPLHAGVESLLRSKGAIFMDFGSAAYVKSELIPPLLLGLIASENSDGSNQNSHEIAILSSELEKSSQERSILTEKLKLLEEEIASQKNQSATAFGNVEIVGGEQSQPPADMNSTSPSLAQFSEESSRHSNESLQKELQKVRSQSIEAIASLKVLEEENEGLRQELDDLRRRCMPTMDQ